MSVLFALLVVLSAGALLLVAPVMALFKRLRPAAKQLAGVSAVVLVVSVWKFEPPDEVNVEGPPREAAKTHSDEGEKKSRQQREWDERAERAAKLSRERNAARKAAEAAKPPLTEDLRQDQITKELAAKLAREKGMPEPGSCRDRLECWGEQNLLTASSECSQRIERLAKFTHEWTDGWLDGKFSHYRWKDKKAGIVTHIGDKVRFQNGFGAWQNMVYECDFDPASRKALDVRAQPGRL